MSKIPALLAVLTEAAFQGVITRIQSEWAESRLLMAEMTYDDTPVEGDYDGENCGAAFSAVVWDGDNRDVVRIEVFITSYRSDEISVRVVNAPQADMDVSDATETISGEDLPAPSDLLNTIERVIRSLVGL